MKLCTHTEPGGKEVNEDCLIARLHPSGQGRYVCLLADGQGGRSHGALAAQTACEHAWKLAMDADFQSLLLPATWDAIFTDTDQAVRGTEGFTTLVALAVDHENVCGGSSGDSKAYYAAADTPTILTEWTAHQAKNPPLGSGMARFETFHQTFIQEGRLLIVSDGVWKYAGYEALQSSFKLPDASHVAAQLREAVIQRGGTKLPDDFSVITLDIRRA